MYALLYVVYIAFNFLDSVLFFLAAEFACIVPFEAAISNFLVARTKFSLAKSLSPFSTDLLNFRTTVFKFDLIILFLRVFFWEIRTLFLADLILAIPSPPQSYYTNSNFTMNVFKMQQEELTTAPLFLFIIAKFGAIIQKNQA